MMRLDELLLAFSDGRVSWSRCRPCASHSRFFPPREKRPPVIARCSMRSVIEASRFRHSAVNTECSRGGAEMKRDSIAALERYGIRSLQQSRGTVDGRRDDSQLRGALVLRCRRRGKVSAGCQKKTAGRIARPRSPVSMTASTRRGRNVRDGETHGSPRSLESHGSRLDQRGSRTVSEKVVERIEKDALERYGLEEMVTNPDLLRRAEPSETLLRAVLRYRASDRNPRCSISRATWFVKK